MAIDARTNIITPNKIFGGSSSASSSNIDYKELDYTYSREGREFSDYFIDRKALPEAVTVGYTYVFFTAPELALNSSRFTGSSNSAYLSSSNSRFLKLPGSGDSIYNDAIVNMLTGDSGTFMKLLFNRVASAPASNITLDTLDYSETWNKYKIPIGTSTKDSKIGGNFEIQFREDPELQIMKTIKLWTDYIEGLFMGDVISAFATASSLSDSQSAIIDYMSSVYTFSVLPDGKTLQHWSKYTGVFPTKQPYDIFASDDGDIKVIERVGIDFQFAYKEDMDITILRDFNLLAGGNASNLTNYTGNYYDSNSVNIGGSSTYPSITKATSVINNRPLYELRLSDPNDINGITQNF
jgi:hypothetical protein